MADILSGFFYIHNANFHTRREGFYKRDETQLLMTVQSNKNYQKTGKRGREERQSCKEQKWLEETRDQSSNAKHHHHHCNNKKPENILVSKSHTIIAARLFIRTKF